MLKAPATSHVPVGEQRLHQMAYQVCAQPSRTSALMPETFGTVVYTHEMLHLIKVTRLDDSG